MVCECASPAVAASGLVAYWKFDEGSGTTVADSSGNGNTGTLVNGPLWTAGRVGNALFFDGIDDNVTVPDSTSLDLSSSFTLSAWVNPDRLRQSDFRSILAKNTASPVYFLYATWGWLLWRWMSARGCESIRSTASYLQSPLVYL